MSGSTRNNAAGPRPEGCSRERVELDGFHTDSCGWLNIHEGEYETAYWFHIVAGIPIWISYQGAFHEFKFSRIKDPTRKNRILQFGEKYLGWQPLPEVLNSATKDDWVAQSSPLSGGLSAGIPLRPRRAFRGVMVLSWFLPIAAILGLCAPIVTLSLDGKAGPLRPADAVIHILTWSMAVLFGPAYYLYRWLGKPSHRQKQIRSIIAEEFGPFTDPAAWRVEFTSLVLRNQCPGLSGISEVLQHAESLAEDKRWDSALLFARLALGIYDKSKHDVELVARCEALTDHCLWGLFAEKDSITQRS